MAIFLINIFIFIFIEISKAQEYPFQFVASPSNYQDNYGEQFKEDPSNKNYLATNGQEFKQQPLGEETQGQLSDNNKQQEWENDEMNQKTSDNELEANNAQQIVPSSEQIIPNNVPNNNYQPNGKENKGDVQSFNDYKQKENKTSSKMNLNSLNIGQNGGSNPPPSIPQGDDVNANFVNIGGGNAGSMPLPMNGNDGLLKGIVSQILLGNNDNQLIKPQILPQAPSMDKSPQPPPIPMEQPPQLPLDQSPQPSQQVQDYKPQQQAKQQPQIQQEVPQQVVQ